MSGKSDHNGSRSGREDREITCRELVEVVTAYLEGVMSAPDRRRFEAHLAECPWCVNYLEQMRGTVAAMGALSEESLSPEARERLVEEFRDWRRDAG